MVALLQVRNALLGHQERASGVDVVHQVVTLHVGLLGGCQRDSASIVDQDVDAAKLVYGTLDRCPDGILIADVNHTGKSLATSCLDYNQRKIVSPICITIKVR